MATALQSAVIALLILIAGRSLLWLLHRHEVWIWPISPSPKQVAKAQAAWWLHPEPLIQQVCKEYSWNEIGPIEFEIKMGKIIAECLKDTDDIWKPLRLPPEIYHRWEFTEDLKLVRRDTRPKPSPDDSLCDPDLSSAAFIQSQIKVKRQLRELEQKLAATYRVPPAHFQPLDTPYPPMVIPAGMCICGSYHPMDVPCRVPDTSNRSSY